MSNVGMDPHLEMLEHIKEILKTMMGTNDHITARIDDIVVEIKTMAEEITELQKSVRTKVKEEKLGILSDEAYHKEEAAWALSDKDD